MTEIQLLNTLTKKKETFQPVTPGRVNMYVCGITSYDYCHVGHARAYITFDVVRRAFEHFGYDVFYIQNFTDIDDKIIDRAASAGVDPIELSERFIAEYFVDMDALNVKRASFYPRVTRHIPEVIASIEKLVENGHAYVAGGSVYFDVLSIKDYGALSGRETSEDELKSRIDDPNKKSSLDFALWKASKPGEPSWESPWGQGRPGWHLECNVMSSLYLGLPFDIHGGGHDLIFPHHENELAIDKGLSPECGFANYWVHNGFVTINEEKMSKSLGNITAIREILAAFPADVIRIFLLSTHYRMPLNFNTKTIEETAAGYARFASLFERLTPPEEIPNQIDDTNSGPLAELFSALGKSAENFDAALADDFNTPGAVAEIFNMVKAGNLFVNEAENQKLGEKEIATGAAAVWGYIKIYGEVLGLDFAALKSAGGAGSDKLNEVMQVLLDIRADARKDKDFALADKIRDKLAAVGIEIKDRPDGAVWSVK